MFGPHALRWIVLAAASLVAADRWRAHGVAAERADRVAAIEQRLRTARLRAADELAQLYLEDFGPDERVSALSRTVQAAMRGQELLTQRDPVSARALLEPFAREATAPPVILLLFGRACQQLGDVKSAESALARFHQLMPQGVETIDAGS